MSSSGARSSRKDSLRLARLLVASFVLTIASFVAATALSEYRARGILSAAESITTTALPSIDCLSRARTELRQLERFLERVTMHENHALGAREDLESSRSSLASTWNECTRVPKYPGEAQLQGRLEANLVEMNTTVETVLRWLHEGNRERAIEELTVWTEPAIDRADATMVAEIDLNARQSTALAAEISELRGISRTWKGVLIGLSVLLAALAALAILGVLRRFSALVETRISDLESFSSRVAHDIRSPLASVTLALELLKRDPQRGLQIGALDRANRSVQRVVELVDGLLVFARAGAPPAEGARAHTDEVLGGIVDQMRPAAEDSGITIMYESSDSALIVATSPGVLISIVSNLVGNAIKYMGQSPVRRIDVRAFDLGRTVRIEVSDTGPGIDPALVPRIFDPYVRGAEGSTPGLGLGLATVRRLVEAHGGTVGFESSEGPGSTFWLALPKAASEPESEPNRGPRQLAPRST